MTSLELREARATLHLTQQGLAEALGTNISNVKNWEQGRYAIPGSVSKLIALLIEAGAKIEGDKK